jgi:hypothetical protein
MATPFSPTPGSSTANRARIALKWIALGALAISPVILFIGASTRGPAGTSDFLDLSGSLFSFGSTAVVGWLVVAALQRQRSSASANSIGA